MASLEEIIIMQDGEEYIKDENDTFHLEKPSAWSFGSVLNALPVADDVKADQGTSDDDRIIDYNKVIKRLVMHEGAPPASKETPYFNHDAFYANLKHYQSRTEGGENNFGSQILYGEVVTSTNTMLEKYD